MAKRNYSNIAVETTLASGIDSSVTSLTVVSATGWPSAPFILVLEDGESAEELVLVESKSGTTFGSLTRGFGGTSGQSHSAGATVKHALAAEDLALIWAHAHGGGDDTAQVSHDDLSGVSTDDHHAEDHGSRHLEDGTDPLGWPGNFEVDDSTEVASQALTVSFADVASVSLSIPAEWGSWKCEAWASYTLTRLGSSTTDVDVVLRIDGTDQQVKAVESLGTSPKGDAIGGRRTGMSTTGSRTISLRAREVGDNAEITDIYLYARAVRTS